MIREGILLSCYGLFLVSTSTNSIHRRTNHTPSSPAIARLPKLHRAILSGLAFPQHGFSNTIPTNPSRLSMEVCFASTPFSIQALWLPLCVFGSARRTFRLPEARESIAPKPLVVPANTTITVVLDESIGSKISSTGQNFSATVSSPIEVDGRIAIPKGARATGIVRDAKSAGRFKGGAVLSVSLASVTVGDATYDLRTTNRPQTSTGKGKRSAGMIGGGGAAGALIGGLAGGGKGAAIGAIVGAGGGTAGAGLTGNREIVFPAETPLTFKILDPVEIKSKR